MRVVTLILSLFYLQLCVCSCSGEGVKDDGALPVLGKGEVAERTVLVYMMAENSLSAFSAMDLDEISRAASSVPNDCRLFVYVDDRSAPRLLQYYRTKDGNRGVLESVPFSDDVCSSNVAVLGQLFDGVLADFPTRYIDLVFWSHGDGWLRGRQKSAAQRSIGIDNGKNSYSDNTTGTIEMEELSGLLKNIPAKVDRILFDACFMQCIEVAYSLRDAAEWIIASPAEIPGHGAPYETVVPAFFLSSGPWQIMDCYVEGYADKASGAVLSAVRTSELDALADIMSYYVDCYLGIDEDVVLEDVFSYLHGKSLDYPYFYDMASVMSKRLTEEEYGLWKSVVDKAVVYVAASPKWYSLIDGGFNFEFDRFSACGVSMYVPRMDSRNEKFNNDFRSTEWYRDAGWQSAGW